MTFARVWFWACVGVVVFVYGVAVGRYEIFPYPAIKFVQDAVEQVYAERTNLLGTRPIHFLNRARHEGDGVTTFDAAKTAPGLTLVTGFFGETSELRLLALDGTAVNRWPVRFYDLFPEPGRHIEPPSRIPATNWNVDLHGALALPDGSVVFNFEYSGLVKLDRCGRTEWTLPRMTHHSVDRAADGGFWVPSRRYRASDSEFRGISAPYYEDTLLKISADGRVETEISVPALLYENGLEALLLANGAPEILNEARDLGHLNDIEELSPAKAQAFPGFEAGDLLLSLRNLNLLLVVDPRSHRVRWHRSGPWLRQHDPDFLDDGRISVFNNNAIVGTQADVMGGSQIVAADPATGATGLLFGGDSPTPVFTHIRGKHQVLPNGNILMTEFAAGRILEVDAGGQAVWQYINRYDADTVAEVSHAIRYSDDFFTVEDWTCG